MTRRRVLGTALALLAIVAAIALGRWQWDRSRTELPGTQLSLAGAVPLAEALGADAAVTAAEGQAPVTVTGTYDVAQQRVVRDGGGAGLDALVVPLQPNGGGTAVVVIRGTIPAGTAVPPPPAGVVEVLGWLRAAEPVDPGDLAGLDADELPAFSPVPFLATVDYSLADATVALAEQQPASPEVTPLPPPSTEAVVRISWRSLGYSLQWFLFVLVVGFVWWRAVWRTPEDAGQ